MKRAWQLLGVWLGLCGALGCSHAERSESGRCSAPDAGAPIDPLLLAFLSRARAAHHLADDHEAEGDLAAAVTPLANLVTGPLPPGAGAGAPEVREVLADTRARLGDLRSRQGAFELALADVQAGLDSARDPNYFRGHLLETQGLVEERHAKALAATNPAEAAAARKRAIALLEQAMTLQSAVLENSPQTPTGAHKPAVSTPPASGTE